MCKSAVVCVLARVANGDNGFQALLSSNPALALREYDLSWEERVAIMTGDIAKVKGWLDGRLDKKTATWLRCRLEQESWG